MSADEKYYLLEDYDPGLTYQDGTIVSLLPEISYELGRRGIAYTKLEDYYREEDLRKEEEGYFFEQLNWLDRFEEYLRSHLSSAETHRLKLARICFNRLKYFMDPVIIQCKILASLVQNLSREGGSIVYVKKRVKGKKRWVENSHFSREATHFEKFLPLLCERYGNVPFVFHFFDRQNPKNEPAPGGRFLSAAGRLIRSVLKRFYHIFKYEKWKRPEKRTLLKARSFLFMHVNTAALDALIRELLREGARVFYRSGQTFLQLNDWLERPAGQITTRGGRGRGRIREECEKAAVRLRTEGEELISWLNGKAGIDLTEFFDDYFRYFLTEVCPMLLAEIGDYKDFYDRQGIDFAVSHTSSDYPAKSAVLAARLAGVKTVCLQHGCDVHQDRAWEMTDLDTFDLYFAADSLSESRFRKTAVSKHLDPCRVFQYPAYLDSIQRSRRHKRPPSIHAGQKTVLYVPSKTALHYRTFNCMVYPSLWFFEFQKCLLEHFSTRWSGIRFIYKHSGREADSALVPALRESVYPNIRLDERKTVECFNQVDAVILDRPTTGFFEAIAAGLPTLCLYPDFIGGMIDAESAEYFSKTLKPFSSVNEATGLIDCFLDRSEEYVQKLPLRYDPVIEILKNNSVCKNPGFVSEELSHSGAVDQAVK